MVAMKSLQKFSQLSAKESDNVDRGMPRIRVEPRNRYNYYAAKERMERVKRNRYGAGSQSQEFSNSKSYDESIAFKGERRKSLIFNQKVLRFDYDGLGENWKLSFEA